MSVILKKNWHFIFIIYMLAKLHTSSIWCFIGSLEVKTKFNGIIDNVVDNFKKRWSVKELKWIGIYRSTHLLYVIFLAIIELSCYCYRNFLLWFEELRNFNFFVFYQSAQLYFVISVVVIDLSNQTHFFIHTL